MVLLNISLTRILASRELSSSTSISLWSSAFYHCAGKQLHPTQASFRSTLPNVISHRPSLAFVDSMPVPEAINPESPSPKTLQNTPHSTPHFEHADPLPGISDHAAIPEASAGSEPSASPTNYPPIPPYSQTCSSAEQPNNTTPTPTARPPPFPLHGADADVVRYNMAHGLGLVHRLPEAFPEYDQSLRSGSYPPESLPPYGANSPPRYARFVARHPGEPQTMTRVFFRYGFCKCSA